MYILPAGSKTTPNGIFNFEPKAGTPSLEYPALVLAPAPTVSPVLKMGLD